MEIVSTATDIGWRRRESMQRFEDESELDLKWMK
jgi:hypothetical protein